MPAPFDEDAALQLPRRNPRDIPDVQILVLEPDVAQSFINWVEGGFRSKGLRAATIWLNPRLPLAAVVKRQIIEGVQAVVKLTKGAQWHSKIALQVFDRNAGASNVNFNEYVDLDVQVAADIVNHARQKERMQVQSPIPPSYPAPASFQPPQHGHYGQMQHTPQPHPHFPPPIPPPSYHQPSPQQPYAYPPQQHSYPAPPIPQAPVTPSTDPANLQALLANLRQPSNAQGQQIPNVPPLNGQHTDLAGLLSNVAARTHNQGQAYSQLPPKGQQPNVSYGGNSDAHGYGIGQANNQQNVQNIMDQLARYNR